MGKKSRTKLLNKLKESQNSKTKGSKIKKLLVAILCLVAVIGGGYLVYSKIQSNTVSTAIDHAQEPENDKVAVIETEKGSIYIQLYKSAAPFTVDNFTKLVKDGFYDGIAFHRVIEDFMIQGGDPNSRDTDPNNDGQGGTGEYFPDEINAQSLGLSKDTIKKLEEQGYIYDDSRQSVKNTVGAVSMANSGPNTNSSQFFIITTKDQPHLDGKHTVFGRVIKGLDVAQQIQQGDIMKKVSLMSLPDFKKQFDAGSITGPNTGGLTVEQIDIDPASPNSAVVPNITIDTKKKE